MAEQKKPRWTLVASRYRKGGVVGLAWSWHDGSHLGIRGFNLTLNVLFCGIHLAYRRWPNVQ